MPKREYKFHHQKRVHDPENTGGLGTMTLIGWDAGRQIHEWRDDETNSIWLTDKGKRYGRLVPSPDQPAGVPPSASIITLPAGTAHRTLHLLDPINDLYEPLGTVSRPAQAHVTDKHGRILLTTCPLLLRVDRPAARRRQLDVRAHLGRWYPSATQTMTPVDHDIDADVYLWRDDVVGGVWQTRPGHRYGRLTHWDGQPADQEWMIPMTEGDWNTTMAASGLQHYQHPAFQAPHAINLWLVDPVNESLVDDSERNRPTVRSRITGRVVKALARPVVRMVNRSHMSDEQQREAMLTDMDTLYKTYGGIEDGEDGDSSGSESDVDSVWESEPE